MTNEQHWAYELWQEETICLTPSPANTLPLAYCLNATDTTTEVMDLYGDICESVYIYNDREMGNMIRSQVRRVLRQWNIDKYTETFKGGEPKEGHKYTRFATDRFVFDAMTWSPKLAAKLVAGLAILIAPFLEENHEHDPIIMDVVFKRDGYMFECFAYVMILQPTD